jgi:hypothetical protein
MNPRRTGDAAVVALPRKRLIERWKFKDLNLDFVPPDLEFVPSGLDFVPKNF